MDPSRPIYTRLSLQHIDPETLTVFELPWEYDLNNLGYLLVKQLVPEDLVEKLWEHTRQLRWRQASKTPDPAVFVNLEDQFHPGPHVSLCVLAPIITIECRHGKLLIAARFNIETTILQYSSKQRDGHEPFLHSVCLQYLHNSAKEDLVTMPESDPSRAFSITKNTKSEFSPQASLSASQTPSGSVSLALTRSTELNVEYAVSSWSVSGHRVVDGHQWYWAGTQEETKQLTPDLTQTVKRHVVVKRRAHLEAFPFDIEELRATEEKVIVPAAKGGTVEGENAELAVSEKAHYFNRLREALRRQFTFRFHAQVRLKRRMGRLHRLLVLSGNDVKAKFLKPVYEVDFSLQPDEKWFGDLLVEGCRAGGGGGNGDGGGGGGGGGGGRGGRGDGERGDAEGDEGNDEERLDFADTAEEIAEEESNSEVSEEEQPRAFMFPLGNSVDIESVLDDVKQKNNGDWDKLQGKRLTDVLDHKGLQSLHEMIRSRKEMERARVKIARETRRELMIREEERRRQRPASRATFIRHIARDR